MTILVLEITESDTELVFGIPQYLQVSTNIPSNVYYTFDGSDPKNTDVAFLATSVIYLPSDQSTFTFRCIAYDGSQYSSEFSNQYSVTTANIRNTRKGNEGGVVVLEYAESFVDSFGFDSEGNAAQGMGKVRHSLDFITSRTNYLGEDIPDSSSKDFINFANVNLSVKPDISSPNNNVNFDPTAKVITILGRTQEEMDQQSVRIINRPYDAFTHKSSFYTENDSKYNSIISGNLIKYVYNNQTGEITFYYYESLESRWIISKQKTDKKSFDFGKVKFGRGNRFVFEWVQDPVMSKLR